MCNRILQQYLARPTKENIYREEFSTHLDRLLDTDQKPSYNFTMFASPRKHLDVLPEADPDTIVEKNGIFTISDKMVYKVTVGRSNCDVVIHSEFVSTHHLDIIWEPLNGNTSYKVTIKDHSTNGTGVNGRKIKNESNFE